MAYDAVLAQRVKTFLEGKPGFAEKKMFGGVCYLLNGNMACGIINADLIVRVGPEQYAPCLQQPHARQFDITGRPMKGWVMVAPAGHGSVTDLSAWVQRGVDFVQSLPPK
jgi:hypothetical protein